jgi:actin related protein 2/3 complex subunit 2
VKFPAAQHSTLTSFSATPVSIDQVVSDFDGVTFHISTQDGKTKILVSIAVKCFPELVKYGAQSLLEREYGPYIVAPEQGYDFSLLVDVESLPQEQGRYAHRSPT